MLIGKQLLDIVQKIMGIGYRERGKLIPIIFR